MPSPFLALITPVDPTLRPEHPIVLPPPPSGNVPSHPIALPGDPWWGADLTPSHPIVIPEPPPGTTPPDGAHPSHPIVLPPLNPPVSGSTKQLVYVFVPGKGGVWFLVEVPPAPTTPTPKK